MRKAAILGSILAIGLGLVSVSGRDAPASTDAAAIGKPQTYQGRTAWQWAMRARANKRDSNLRGRTILRLKRTLAHRPDIREAVALASIAYPEFSQHRAWCIIRHESWMTRHPLFAKNPRSSATGLYQFLTSTYASTPYGKAGFSIYSAYAQSLAAGWMHANGRGREWAISC